MKQTITKEQALATYLSINADDIEDGYDAGIFDAEGCEYMVLTDDEADQKAADYIRETVWAFNADFIAGQSNIDYDAVVTMVKALQDKCEGANDAITALIVNMDEFIDDAIGADGRGHFMSSYDGEENEQGEYFIYRLN
ncbi:MAG: hypothetical protein V3R78_10045 [Thermodesulfobacteriota bacterium]